MRPAALTAAQRTAAERALAQNRGVLAYAGHMPGSTWHRMLRRMWRNGFAARTADGSYAITDACRAALARRPLVPLPRTARPDAHP